MKKIIIVLLAIAVISITTINAQTYLQGGLNIANISTSNDGQTQSSNAIASFNAGFMGRFGISDFFDLEAGALFTGQGAKSVTNYGTNTITTTFRPYYVQVPLNAVVKFPLGDPKITKANIFIFAGPYAAIGVGGHSKTTNSLDGSEQTNSIKFDNEDPFTSDQENAAYDKLKLWDFGINMGAGIDFGPILVKAQYGLGLTKINSEEGNNEENDKDKYRTVSVSLGIKLY
ncbi:MAG TPA: porin family protein [Ferruginibacter sp.]|jgi:hypothetical protein|nr:porin family protein [Ferruginibacter sp.]